MSIYHNGLAVKLHVPLRTGGNAKEKEKGEKGCSHGMKLGISRKEGTNRQGAKTAGDNFKHLSRSRRERRKEAKRQREKYLDARSFPVVCIPSLRLFPLLRDKCLKCPRVFAPWRLF
jgi:hypothetical protein